MDTTRSSGGRGQNRVDFREMKGILVVYFHTFVSFRQIIKFNLLHIFLIERDNFSLEINYRGKGVVLYLCYLFIILYLVFIMAFSEFNLIQCNIRNVCIFSQRIWYHLVKCLFINTLIKCIKCPFGVYSINYNHLHIMARAPSDQQSNKFH